MSNRKVIGLSLTPEQHLLLRELMGVKNNVSAFFVDLLVAEKDRRDNPVNIKNPVGRPRKTTNDKDDTDRDPDSNELVDFDQYDNTRYDIQDDWAYPPKGFRAFMTERQFMKKSMAQFGFDINKDEIIHNEIKRPTRASGDYTQPFEPIRPEMRGKNS